MSSKDKYMWFIAELRELLKTSDSYTKEELIEATNKLLKEYSV